MDTDIDNWLEEAYEDRFYVVEVDYDDGFEFGWDSDELEEN